MNSQNKKIQLSKTIKIIIVMAKKECSGSNVKTKHVIKSLLSTIDYEKGPAKFFESDSGKVDELLVKGLSISYDGKTCELSAHDKKTALALLTEGCDFITWPYATVDRPLFGNLSSEELERIAGAFKLEIQQKEGVVYSKNEFSTRILMARGYYDISCMTFPEKGFGQRPIYWAFILKYIGSNKKSLQLCHNYVHIR